jgi:hypothetical protein
MTEPVVVVFTGSRDLKTAQGESPIRAALSKLPPRSVVFHGACRGADELCDRIGRELGLTVIRVPVDHKKHGPWPGAGPRRNADMVRKALMYAAAHGLSLGGIAFPLPGSKGTVDCANQMREMKIPVITLAIAG